MNIDECGVRSGGRDDILMNSTKCCEQLAGFDVNMIKTAEC